MPYTLQFGFIFQARFFLFTAIATIDVLSAGINNISMPSSLKEIIKEKQAKGFDNIVI